MNFLEQARQQFTEQCKLAREPEKVLRQAAWAQFERQGLPARGNEAWKYSSLNQISQKSWTTPTPSENLPAKAEALIRQWRDQFDVAVMVNGQLHKKASRLTLEAGYEFKSLAAASESLHMDFDDGMISLAAAANSAGYYLRVEPKVSFPKPLLIVHCASGDGTWTSTLNRIELADGAQMQVAEVFVGERAYLRTDVTKVDLAPQANLTWVRLQEESIKASHFSEVQVALQNAAILNLSQLNVGGEWARHSLKIKILGEHAEANVQGLTFGGDHQHLDQRVNVEHRAGNSSSAQLFKGVLKDHARGILNGKIYIARDAQKVNSSQLNHNLLMSNTAEADTKPELEIYADDVKANHGASVGKMDESKLFYLLSRAIPRAEATQMLAQAFVGDVLMKIPAKALRDLASEQVEAQLKDFVREMETLQ